MNHIKPLEFAKTTLIEYILNGKYTIGERLPAERELAEQLGVTRPTLREALRHLEQDGWLRVQHGKPTVVRDFWREGGMGVLSRIVTHHGYIKPSFITDLLEFRLLIAPAFARDAIEHNPEKISAVLSKLPAVDESPQTFVDFDWQLQHDLALASGNVVFPLIVNGFESFFRQMAVIYFQPHEARWGSHQYYQALAAAATDHDSIRAYLLTEQVMQSSIKQWECVSDGLQHITLDESDNA